MLEEGRSMITADFIQKAMHEMSSTEIDFYLYLFRVVDWDGNVRSIVEQIASNIGSSVLYVRHLIQKGIKKGFLERDCYDHDLIRLCLASSDVNFEATTARYCKKYYFLYTPEFRSLSVNSKRILLMAAFRMSISGIPFVVFEKKEIFHRLGSVSLNLPLDDTKYQRVLQEISKIMGQFVTVAQVCDRMTKRPQLIVAFRDDILSSFYENYTELFVLQRAVSQLGLGTVLERAHCIEILKTVKYLMRVVKDRRLARAIYNRSLERMKSFYKSNGDKSPAGASAYFSKIVHEIMKEELLAAAQQIQYIEELRGNFNTTIVNRLDENPWMINIKPISIFDIEYERKLKEYREVISLLLTSCETWITARLKGKTSLQNRSEQSLHTFISEDFESLKSKYVELKGIIGHKEEGNEVQRAINMYHKRIQSLLDNNLPVNNQVS